MQRGEKLSGRSVFDDGHHCFGKPLLSVSRAGLFAAAIGLAAMHSGWHVNVAAGSSIGATADTAWEATGATAQERLFGSSRPLQAHFWQLDEVALRRVLEQALPEGEDAIEKSSAILSLPMPEGTLARFRIVDSPMLAPELVVQYPQIKSYRGQGEDNPALTMRCSWAPSGVSALITDGARTVMIHPAAWFRQGPPERTGPHASSSTGQDGNNATATGEVEYVSYYGQDYKRAAEDAMCLVTGDQPSDLVRRRAERRARLSVENFSYGDTLRTYRIALAVTPQYVTAIGGNGGTNVMDKLNAWLSAVNGILQNELAVKLTLAAVIYDNNGVAFSNGNAAVLLDEARSAMKSLNPSSYDLGHVLGTGSGGNAYIGVMGETLSDSQGPYKAAGVTLMSAAGTVGNSTDLIAFLHELGHQLGATHTFNGTKGSCGTGGRTGETAFETGSGMTIMSLGGACGATAPAITDNIVTARSPYFHSGSLAQIVEYIDSFGGMVGTASSTGNNPPTITQPVGYTGNYVIPKKTPFALAATATDAQSLAYAWEQIDPGATDYANAPYSDDNDPSPTLPITTRPIFRPFAPALTSTRTFPLLQYILSNSNVPPTTVGGLRTAESLSGASRALNFRVVVRDQVGGVSSDTVRTEVDATAGPFVVTQPNTAVSWAGGSTQTVTWDVAGTGAGTAVNCANVKISLSIDGGNTFPHVLAASAPNNGSATIVVPFGLNSSSARVKVEAVGNIFFDISDVNLMVTPGCSYSVSSAGQAFSASGGTGTVQVTATTGCPWMATSNAGWLTITAGTSGNGNGTVSYSVVANSGTTRTGTITIAGQVFTVTQVGPQSGNGLMFYPLPRPVRLMDTRAGQGNCDNVSTPIAAGTSITMLARTTCEGVTIPANAQAVVGNLTVINQDPQNTGYLTIYPDGQAVPLASNIIYYPGQIIANQFTVGLSSAGKFNVFGQRAIDVIVDISGYYAPPGVGGLYYHPLSKPIRLLDTRAGQGNCDSVGTPIAAGTSLTTLARTTCEGVTIPAAVQAIAANSTVINVSGQAGYLTIYPNGVSVPLASNMIYYPGQILANAFTVSLNANGEFNIFGERQIDMIVDVAGYYSAEAADANGAGLLLTPLVRPLRTLDTRAGQGNCDAVSAAIVGGTSIATAGWLNCEGITLPNTARALLGNMTVINQTSQAGYLTLYPDGVPAPLASNLIYQPGQLLSNAFVAGVNAGTGQFRIFAERTLDAIVDVSGYFAP